MHPREAVEKKMPKPRKSKRHPLYPEPGAWVLGNTKGMPEVLPPKAPVDGHALTAQEVRDQYVSYEGLGYCIYYYVPTDKIADKQLAKLWEQARLAMQSVVEYLEEIPSLSEERRRAIRRVTRRRQNRLNNKRLKTITDLDLGKDAEEQEV